MQTSNRLMFIAAPLLWIAACGGDEPIPPGGHTMSTHAEALGARVVKVKEELASHKMAVHGAADVAAINAHEGTHHTTELGHLEGMEHDLTDMTMCKDAAGSMPNTAAFATLRADADKECKAHNAAMTTAGTLAQAHTEEDRHQAAMDSLVARMTTSHEEMMHAAASFSCMESHEQGH